MAQGLGCGDAVPGLLGEGLADAVEEVHDALFPGIPLARLLADGLLHGVQLLGDGAEHLLQLADLEVQRRVVLGPDVHRRRDRLEPRRELRVPRGARRRLRLDVVLHLLDPLLEALVHGEPEAALLVDLALVLPEGALHVQHGAARIHLQVLELLLREGELARERPGLLADQLPLDREELGLLLVDGLQLPVPLRLPPRHGADHHVPRLVLRDHGGQREGRVVAAALRLLIVGVDPRLREHDVGAHRGSRTGAGGKAAVWDGRMP
mmetsp:Transcript_27512/g.77832  ORF Transcript_27512/g.77832 Transcript_27512/m.77832 type:complete len:265 (-) Transcript_27512:20-814(-)